MVDYFSEGAAAVTGAASGIGQATAVAFARDGCRKLLLGDVSLEGLEKTRQIIQEGYPSARVVISLVDVTDEKAVEAFCASGLQEFSRLDFAANVAGYGHPAKPSTEISIAEFDKTFDVNLKGVFLCQRAQLRQMVTQDPLPGYHARGSIVNVTSICSTNVMLGLMPYSGSKSGVLGLSRTDALDFGPEQIRINCVAPGSIVTPMLLSAMGEGHMEHYTENTPLRRLGNPEEVANAIVWLSSPMASYVTGASLPVDGGLALATGPP